VHASEQIDDQYKGGALILHSAYLFDAEQYRQTIAPLIPAIESGDYHALRQLAWDTIQANSSVWSFLEQVQLGCSAEDFEHDEKDPNNVRFWLMVVLGQFLKSTYSLHDYWGNRKLLERALPLAGWTLQEITLLVVGESMCTLLAPHHVSDPIIRSHWVDGKRSPWCEFGEGAGWLGITVIQYLHSKLLRTQEDYPELYIHPLVQQEITSYKDQVRTDKLQVALEEVDTILSSAIEAKKALFLTVN